MNVLIENFKIEGLYGNRNYLIELDNNQLILVGENGSGKSTVVSILHYVLTSQWQKLIKFDFKSLTITINGKPYHMSKGDVTSFVSSGRPSNTARYVSQRLDELEINPKNALAAYSD